VDSSDRAAAYPFGSKARDTVTGFTGIVTARTEYLADTPSLRLTAENGQDDLKERWVAEARCEPVTDDRKAGFSR
jgi:hypothetical protein